MRAMNLHGLKLLADLMHRGLLYVTLRVAYIRVLAWTFPCPFDVIYTTPVRQVKTFAVHEASSCGLHWDGQVA